MKVIYEGTEIKLEISNCKIKDNMGGKADSLTISFADIKNECRQWEFKKNHIIEIIEGKFSTGKMYVNEFECGKGKYTVRAVSIQKKAKTIKNRIWEKVNFLDIANDIAKEEDLQLESYGVNDFQYERVEQIDKNNMEFLNYRCILEGYNLKISNRKILIVSEKFLIDQSPVLRLNTSNFIGDYNFKAISNQIYGGCEVSSFFKNNLKGSYIENNNEEILRVKNISGGSLGEANRFAENILKNANKYEITGSFYMENNFDIAAGNSIKIDGLGTFNGKYIIESIIYDLLNGKSKLFIRKVE